jgi:hypothetical protein
MKEIELAQNRDRWWALLNAIICGNMWEKFLLDEKLLGSQEELGSVELRTAKYW